MEAFRGVFVPPAEQHGVQGMERQEKQQENETTEPGQMAGGFPPFSHHIPFSVSCCSFCRRFDPQLRLLSLSGPVSWPDLSPPMEGSPGFTPKGNHRETKEVEEERRGGGPLELDLEARGGGDEGFRPIKSNDVVGQESRAAARISPEASQPSSVSSSGG